MEIEVVNYIKEARSHGLADLEIKQNLLKAGWDASAVEESLAYVRAQDSKQPETAKDEAKSVAQEIKITQPGPAVAQPNVSVGTSNQPVQPMGDAAVTAGKKSGKLWKIILAVVVIGLLAGGGAYAYYNYVLNSPDKVWNKFTQNPQATVVQSDVTFSYQDPNALDSSSTPFALKNLKFNFTGNIYSNITDPKNPQSETSVQYTYASGNTSFSTGFQYILKDNVLYVNIGDNPLFSAIFSSSQNGQKISWLKFDLNAMKQQASSTPSGIDTTQWDKIFDTDFTNQIEKIWNDAKVIKVSSFEGREKVNGMTTLHFKNEIDKEALKTAANQIVGKFVDAFKQGGLTVNDSDASNITFAINTIIDKIQIQDMQTWVGQSDYRLYKVHFVSNAPSIVSAIQYFQNNPPSFMSVTQSRDAKRLADVRQMASALELYFNDYNGYPAANNNGQPAGGISPTYIGLVPTAPTPADGTCTDYYNAYWYQPSGKKHVVKGQTVYDSYTLTFCLGSDTGAYRAGIAQLSPSGITNIACPSPDQSQCVSSGTKSELSPSVQDTIKKIIDGIQFNASVTIDATYHDYGTVKTLTPPSDAYDIMGQAMQKSRDAMRLADVRQFASALELYYNDKNAYPSSLQQLGPSYIDQVRTAPTPADGTCTDAQNNFTYTMENNNSSYNLTFCLGADTGGYQAGVHTLSPSGIQ